jgi:hypothetical protein
MRGMPAVTSCVSALCLLAMVPAFAKNDAPTVPQYMLNAHTVAVIIDPEAGVSMRDPNANQTARRDVEKALLSWGRFEPIMSVEGADLVILVRKGSKSPADVTIADPRQNRRGGVIEPTDNGIGIGVQRGPSPQSGREGGPSVPVGSGPASTTPTTQAGTPGDVFEVYDGKVDHPLDGSPGWRYVKKDALHAHDVPAVAEFRNAIAEAEKQAAKQKGNHP